MLDEKKCTKCGMCREVCPVYKVMLDERYSPRGKNLIKEAQMPDKTFYYCTLCLACEKSCPIGVKMETAEVRAELARRMQTTANKEMIKNVREFGNPFGKLEKGQKPDKLYCC